MTGVGGGGGGTYTVYNTTSRYAASTTTNQECYILSSSTVWTGLSWSRSTTSLTVTRNNHGHTTGNRVILRDVNEPYLNATITAYDTNTFTVTCNDTGNTSGTACAYSLGFSITISAGSLSIAAPSGLDGNGIQLHSLRFRATTSTSSGGTFLITVPQGVTNGVGGNSSLGDINVPIFSVRVNADQMGVVAPTIYVNQSGGGYNVYQLNALNASIIRLFSLNF